jgi:integrase
MPKRKINQLETETPAELDKLTTLSNSHSKPKAKKKPQPVFLEAGEIANLFRVITSPRDRAMFRLAYHGGLRASELGLLQMRDFNAKTDRVYVHRLKGSNSGEHPLTREESRALRAWLKQRGDFPGPIFPSRKRQPISRKMLHVLMQKYGAAAGIDKRRRHFHVLKHSCATQLLSKGFHVEQVQDWLGHVNIQNTMIYAKITNSRRDEMAEKLKDGW